MALLTKVKTRMAVHAHRKVRGLLAGEYASVHTGRSMDFNDLREYVVGDEVKDIDWKASARHGDLLVKRYAADRKHTLTLVVATGRSMSAMCDPQTSKRDLAVLVAGIMGWLATRHGDYVCLVSGGADGVHVVRPSTSEVDLERMLQTVHDECRPDAPATDLSACLDWAIKGLRRRTIMVVVADDVDLDADDEDRLRRLRAQHEILYVSLNDMDPADPRIGDRDVVDVDSREALPAFVRRDAQLLRELIEQEEERHQRRRRQLHRLGIASEHVESEADVVNAIFRLLERHRHAA